MDPQTRENLSKPFPKTEIRQRKGSFGKTLSYVETSSIIERLNSAFDADWAFTIISHQTLETGEVLVHGRLTASGISKEAFGRSQVIVSRDTGEVISAADAYKSAASDALKRCARLLGVALHLYRDEADQVEPRHNGNRHQAPVKQAPTRQVPTGDRITSKQLSYLWTLARKTGHDSDSIRRLTEENYGCQPEHLSKREASMLLEMLHSASDGRGAA
jgi:hypothetical protein